MAQLGAQLAALHALVPANVRPLLPVAAAAALGVLLLLPSSVLGAFLLGLLLGPALLAGVAVLLVLSLLQSAPPWEADSLRSTVPAHIAAAEDVHADTEQLQGQQLLDAISHDMAQTLVNWPPSIPGSCKWWASLQGRRLVLACRPEADAAGAVQDGSAHNKRGEPGRATLPSSPSAKPGAEEARLIVKEIDLDGCSVEVLKEAIQGRSRWLRKAPLRLSHPQRPLLDAHRELLLFAAGSAAKEQWHTALSSACDKDRGPGAAVAALYETFCERARTAAAVPYAQMQEAEEEADSGRSPSGKGPGRRRWLSRWLPKGGGGGSGGHRLTDRLHAGAQRARGSFSGGSGAKGNKGEARQGSAELPERRDSGPPPVMNPVDMDSLWMGGRTPQLPSGITDPAAPISPPKTPVRSHNGKGAPKGVENAVTGTGAAEQPEECSGMPEGTELRKLNHLQPISLPASPLVEDESADAEGLSDKPEDYSSDEDPANPTSPSKAHAVLPPGGGATAVRSGSGGSRGQRSGRRHRWRQEAAEKLPAAPVEAAVNMLLARAGFDLLRSADFKDRVAAQIRRKLALQRIPDYINSLEVVDVDLGSNVPTITNLRALPCPADALWPQVVFDLDYPGGLSVIIEARIDLRDSTSWDTLDRAITRLGGAAAGNAAGAVASAAAEASSVAASVAAAAAASAEVAADSDDEDAAGEGVSGEGRRARRKRFGIGGVRSYMATRIRSLAEATAEQISRMHLRVRVDIHGLAGTVCAWVPPPPGDRLWFGFVSAPELRAEAAPLLNQNIGAHVLMASYRAAQVPAWVGDKLQSAIGKNLTLPSCADIPLPHLLAVDAPSVAAFLPAFLESLHAEHAEDEVRHEEAEVAPDNIARRASAGAGRVMEAARAAAGHSAGSSAPESGISKGDARAAKFTLRWPRRKPGAKEETPSPSHKGSAAQPLPTNSQQQQQEAPPPALPVPVAVRGGGRHRRRSAEAHAHSQQQEPDLALEMSAFTSPERGEELQPLQPLRHPLAAPPPPLPEKAEDPMRVAAAATTVQRDVAGTTAASAVLDMSVAPAADAAVGTDVVAVVAVRTEGSGDVPVAEHSISGPPECGQPAVQEGAPAEGYAAGDVAQQLAGQQGAQQPAVPQQAVSSPGDDGVRGLAHALPAGAAAAMSEPGSSTGMAEEEPGNELQAGEEPDFQEEHDFAAQETAGGADAESELLGSSRGSSSDAQMDERGYMLAGAEGSGQLPPSGDGGASPSGKWREVGTAMGKKYLEAFKSRNQLTYAQGRKMAEKVAGQAQEQMRKALAARERAAAAAKQEKRA